MSWGREYKTLKEIERETGTTPKALRDRPALRASNRHYLEAFYELSAGRSIGEVPQPISITSFKDQCWLWEVRPVEREFLHRLMRRLDTVFLLDAAKRREAEIASARKG